MGYTRVIVGCTVLIVVCRFVALVVLFGRADWSVLTAFFALFGVGPSVAATARCHVLSFAAVRPLTVAICSCWLVKTTLTLLLSPLQSIYSVFCA
jgi:hypothetical protein